MGMYGGRESGKEKS